MEELLYLGTCSVFSVQPSSFPKFPADKPRFRSRATRLSGMNSNPPFAEGIGIGDIGAGAGVLSSDRDSVDDFSPTTTIIRSAQLLVQCSPSVPVPDVRRLVSQAMICFFARLLNFFNLCGVAS
ncbi:hypothetical protein HYFRA_00003763 [Hymenoscyphus fraxineus]|uniref:Uncharacterized protein n=1 Tax=Hymenoscyphus fraxineus TaxID=746836 RepID=A0A9N9KYL3_9HELO|nr:hypothetical protein HYFRA_00003763 [Hymenoscyphus fraxineus]